MIRLLICDDHPVLRKGLRMMLEAAGDIEVVAEAGDGQQALAAIIQHKPEIVLMDIAMPVMNGIDTLRALQDQRRDCRVIVLSTYHNETYAKEALNAGAWGYILKGESGDEVLDAVRHVAKGKRHFSATITEHMRELMLNPQSSNPLDSLSTRERQVLHMVVEGKTSAEIGSLLHLSPKTVDTYRGRLMQKLNVSDMPSLIRLAIRLNVIPEDQI